MNSDDLADTRCLPTAFLQAWYGIFFVAEASIAVARSIGEPATCGRAFFSSLGIPIASGSLLLVGVSILRRHSRWGLFCGGLALCLIAGRNASSLMQSLSFIVGSPGVGVKEAIWIVTQSLPGLTFYAVMGGLLVLQGARSSAAYPRNLESIVRSTERGCCPAPNGLATFMVFRGEPLRPFIIGLLVATLCRSLAESGYLLSYSKDNPLSTWPPSSLLVVAGLLEGTISLLLIVSLYVAACRLQIARLLVLMVAVLQCIHDVHKNAAHVYYLWLHQLATTSAVIEHSVFLPLESCGPPCVAALFMWTGWVYVSHAPYCIRCGYNLTGNVSGTCPECGTEKGDKSK